jgi:hypothetical protein
MAQPSPGVRMTICARSKNAVGHFENGKQVGAWTAYDAKGKGRQIDEDEGPGDMARCCSEARAAQKISAQPAGSTISGVSFIAVGLGGGVQNFAVDGDGF